MPYDLNKKKEREMSRRERVLGHQKAPSIVVGVGTPNNREGSEGDLTLRKVSQGLVLYIKRGNIWYDVNNLNDEKDLVSLADDGYLVLPNGFILQWGQETAASASETVTFPIAFPNACLNVTCTDYDSGTTGGLTSATGIKTLPTRTTVIFTCYTTADTFFWQAIGY